MVILDQNLIHAGTASMTCGYAPIHSPRYFTSVHPKAHDIDTNFTYDKFDLFGNDCAFCKNCGVTEIFEKLKRTFSITNSNGVSLGAKNYSTDWIAGDLKQLGWVVVRSGVSISHQYEQNLAHDFQTIPCTNKMLKNTGKGKWSTYFRYLDQKQSQNVRY